MAQVATTPLTSQTPWFSSVVIDGGKGADFIGRTTVSFSATNASVMGGAGHDTIRFRDAYSAVALGAGNDSIAIGSISGVDSSINGGAGADSITVLSQSFEIELPFSPSMVEMALTSLHLVLIQLVREQFFPLQPSVTSFTARATRSFLTPRTLFRLAPTGLVIRRFSSQTVWLLLTRSPRLLA